MDIGRYKWVLRSTDIFILMQILIFLWKIPNQERSFSVDICCSGLVPNVPGRRGCIRRISYPIKIKAVPEIGLGGPRISYSL
ncbi:hypothetical protein Fmac_002476 [Flemingia macrophylla]|uniref:Uncharacterized protein n=1 Tax=Flemingia macrophylla TaxID=520843 RepID=A0ABD1NK14_9FABA